MNTILKWMQNPGGFDNAGGPSRIGDAYDIFDAEWGRQMFGVTVPQRTNHPETNSLIGTTWSSGDIRWGLGGGFMQIQPSPVGGFFAGLPEGNNLGPWTFQYDVTRHRLIRVSGPPFNQVLGAGGSYNFSITGTNAARSGIVGVNAVTADTVKLLHLDARNFVASVGNETLTARFSGSGNYTLLVSPRPMWRFWYWSRRRFAPGESPGNASWADQTWASHGVGRRMIPSAPYAHSAAGQVAERNTSGWTEFIHADSIGPGVDFSVANGSAQAVTTVGKNQVFCRGIGFRGDQFEGFVQDASGIIYRPDISYDHGSTADLPGHMAGSTRQRPWRREQAGTLTTGNTTVAPSGGGGTITLASGNFPAAYSSGNQFSTGRIVGGVNNNRIIVWSSPGGISGGVMTLVPGAGENAVLQATTNENAQIVRFDRFVDFIVTRNDVTINPAAGSISSASGIPFNTIGSPFREWQGWFDGVDGRAGLIHIPYAVNLRAPGHPNDNLLVWLTGFSVRQNVLYYDPHSYDGPRVQPLSPGTNLTVSLSPTPMGRMMSQRAGLSVNAYLQNIHYLQHPINTNQQEVLSVHVEYYPRANVLPRIRMKR